MTITKAYARKLIAKGKASIATRLKPDEAGAVYVAIDRHDIARTDHYLA